jgi:hypothetical protein
MPGKKFFTTFATQKKILWEEEIKKQRRERSLKDHSEKAVRLQKRKLQATSLLKKAVN